MPKQRTAKARIAALHQEFQQYLFRSRSIERPPCDVAVLQPLYTEACDIRANFSRMGPTQYNTLDSVIESYRAACSLPTSMVIGGVCWCTHCRGGEALDEALDGSLDGSLNDVPAFCAVDPDEELAEFAAQVASLRRRCSEELPTALAQRDQHVVDAVVNDANALAVSWPMFVHSVEPLDSGALQGYTAHVRDAQQLLASLEKTLVIEGAMDVSIVRV
jgi:hypothetical protein